MKLDNVMGSPRVGRSPINGTAVPSRAQPALPRTREKAQSKGQGRQGTHYPRTSNTQHVVDARQEHLGSEGPTCMRGW